LKRVIFIWVLIPITLLGITFTQQEKSFIQNNSSVNISLMPDFAPFSYKREEQAIIGFEHDLLDLLSKKTGLHFKKHYNIWNKNLHLFKTHSVDMIGSISYSKPRANYTLYTKPYYNIPIMIFVRDDFGKYKGLQSLEHKKIGILKDVFYTKELTKIPNIELVIFETYDEITKSLVFGKIDALIQNLPNINYLIQKNLYTNLQLAGELQLPNIQKEDLRFGINPAKPLLHSIIQKGLDSITNEEWNTLSFKWFYVKSKSSEHLCKLTPKEDIYLQTKKLITMCIDPNWMPFESFDEKQNYTGMSADYYKLFAKILNIEFKVIHTNSWTESLEYAKQRKCDILSLAMPTPQREKYLNFTTPYLKIPLVVATRLEVPFINEISELNGKNVAIPKGYAFAEIIKAKYPKINIIDVKDIDEGLQKVRNNELYAYIGTLTSIGYKIQSHYLGEIKITGKIADNWDLGIGVRDDDATLFTILQKAIYKVSKEQHREILNKWVSVKYEKNTDYTLIWQIIGVSLIIIGLITYRHNELSKANKLLQEAQKEIENKNKLLEQTATTDKLTGLYNRVKIDETLYSEFLRSQRSNEPFSLAIVDIDYFKQVNDTYGHLEGDNILKSFATLLSSHIRKTDTIGRWGGEEFLIICPQTELQGSLKMLENLRQEVEQYPFDVVGHKTASFGVTTFLKEDTIESLIKRADDALYQAKNTGRNKIVHL
jgi:polar amino acid transport system substrate-binding protein